MKKVRHLVASKPTDQAFDAVRSELDGERWHICVRGTMTTIKRITEQLSDSGIVFTDRKVEN